MALTDAEEDSNEMSEGSAGSSSTPCPKVQIKIIDELGIPISGTRFTIGFANGEKSSLTTDGNGILSIPKTAGKITIEAEDSHEFEKGDGVTTPSGKHLTSY